MENPSSVNFLCPGASNGAVYEVSSKLKSNIFFVTGMTVAFKIKGKLSFPEMYILENLLHVNKLKSCFSTHGDIHRCSTTNRDNVVLSPEKGDSYLKNEFI